MIYTDSTATLQSEYKTRPAYAIVKELVKMRLAVDTLALKYLLYNEVDNLDVIMFLRAIQNSIDEWVNRAVDNGKHRMYISDYMYKYKFDKGVDEDFDEDYEI
jgi:hypothetical protein